MGEDEGEVFLSLEDDGPVVPAAFKPALGKNDTTSTPVNAVNRETNTTVLEADLVDVAVMEQAGGSFEVMWPLTAMDCPDCASKATRALNHMKQVSEPKISPTSGEIKVMVDLEHGSMAEISSVLRSLGHPPNVEHHELVGAKASDVAKRNGVPLQKLERVVKQQPGVLDAEVSEDDRILVQLVSTANQQLIDARQRAFKSVLGKPPEFLEATSNRIRPDQWRLIGAGIAVPILLMLIAAELLGIEGRWIGLLALPGVVVSGYQMFAEAIASLKTRQIGFQVLTSLAVIGACILEMWEEALIVAILVAFTAHLETDALVKARQAMQGGLDRLPRTARKVIQPFSVNTEAAMSFSTCGPASENIMKTGPILPMAKTVETETVPVDLIRPGDRIEIRSGELIPADGRILEGKGALDKAPLTGESVPVDVGTGDVIEAGLILARGPVVCEVLAVGENTRLSGLIEAVHTFREEPPRLHSSIELFTSIWVPTVLFGAFVVWYFLFPVDEWKIILLLWVVACPCALLLATPVPHAAALSNAAQSGVIVRGGDALERMAHVNHVLLDKTGTLTSGRPTVGGVIMAKGRRRAPAMSIMMGLEARSSHPYALAVMDHCSNEGIEPANITDISDIDAGVEGRQGSTTVAFIRPDKASELDISMPQELQAAFSEAQIQGHGASLLVKGKDGIALMTFVHDDTRDGSADLIASLHNLGINVEILSGDHTAAVTEFARKVGLPETSAHGGLSPEQKVAWVKNRSATHVTMMVGDGFNDAAALAVADVGVAVGTGETVNLEAADILLPGDDPRVLSNMVTLARRAQRTLMQNLFFSVIITVMLVTAVVQQWYDQIWVGVLIHEASVILVILNGARLARQGQVKSLLKSTFVSMYNDTLAALRLFKDRYLVKPATA